MGTARNTTSKVWFTVANGVLSDVYFPTNDNTNVETLQYIVSDGSSFTDLQTRDTTYTVQADRRPRADLPRHHDGQERALQDRHRLHDRPVAPDRPHPLEVRRAQGQAVGLPPLRPPRPDAQRQRRRRQRHHRQRRRRRRRAGQRRRPHAARRLGHRHEDQRRQPRLRDPGVLGARRQPRLRPGDQRLRRPAPATASSSSTPATRSPTCTTAPCTATSCRWGACRSATTAASPSRSATATRRPAPSPPASARCGTASTRRAPRLRARLERLRRELVKPRRPARRLVAALERHPRRVLPQRQLREGRRGQDLPRRGRRLADLAVGPGGLGRRPGEHLLRLLSRGLRARPLRGVDGGLPGRRPRGRPRT